jgi:hypothetical protein
MRLLGHERCFARLVIVLVVEAKGGVEGWRNRSLLCKRVLITSRGCTTKVEIVPAERPAIVSTSAGEMRAWLSVICKEFLFSWWRKELTLRGK